MWKARACCLGALALVACVPADEALGLGGVQFTFAVSLRTREGVTAAETADGWSIRFDRVVLGFKTMTIGKVGETNVCSYRGRGETSDVVFDPRFGVVQSFNGIEPVECPDVGLIFGAPSNETTLGNGASSRDLVELASGVPAHGIVEATVRREQGLSSRPNPSTYRILLRFDSERTSTRFGGCRAAARGVRILEGRRDDVPVWFAAEHLFRDAISSTAKLRVQPFVRADAFGNDDHVVTMGELDQIPLSSVFDSEFYQLSDGTTAASFGDYVRELFRFTIMYRTEDGLCVGNEPGSEEGGQRAPSL